MRSWNGDETFIKAGREHGGVGFEMDPKGWVGWTEDPQELEELWVNLGHIFWSVKERK